MDSLFTINGDALQAAFTIDQSKLSVDMSNALNLSSGLQNMPAVPEPNMDEIAGKIKFEVTPEQTRDIVDNVMAGYKKYLLTHPIDLAIPTRQQELLRLHGDARSPSHHRRIRSGHCDGKRPASSNRHRPARYMQTTMTTYMGAMATELQTQVTAALQQSMNQMAANMASAMSIDPDKFKDAFQMNMSEEELGELMMSLMSSEDASYDNNLKKLGYADLNKPGAIDIYPVDFESKEKVIEILDATTIA